MKSGIEKINKICESVITITEEEISKAEKMAKEQRDYLHPLKMATSKWQHDLGNHNIKVLNAFRELKRVIKEGENITPPYGG